MPEKTLKEKVTDARETVNEFIGRFSRLYEAEKLPGIKDLHYWDGKDMKCVLEALAALEARVEELEKECGELFLFIRSVESRLDEYNAWEANKDLLRKFKTLPKEAPDGE
jgi:hypothetical protein